MARLFAAASSQYLAVGATPVTEPPFTVAFWLKSTNISSAPAFFTIGNTGDSRDNWELYLKSGGAVALMINNALDIAPTSATLSSGVWAHVCAVEGTTTDRSIFVNGGVREPTRQTKLSQI